MTDTEPDRWRITDMTCNRPPQPADLSFIGDALAEQLNVDNVAIIDCQLQGDPR